MLISTGIPNDHDIVRFHALSMVLFTTLNLCFELGEEVISFLPTKIPQSYRDIFRILYREQIIDEPVMHTMSGLGFYRNRLAHQYAGLTSEDLVAIVTNIDTIRIYIRTLIGKSQDIV